ncbi:T9SS type A sorting domain-containing protein [Pedobacter nanyangensis]|uniref:T9SS type A sorting domain-containing protein n=1 Tax=Pedobacter nanyangensis TaxID=1562389 RepID=UPI0013B3F8FF|nr:T9SS type A sorting domain-containing protein [Pedobacter nanyangensis]
MKKQLLMILLCALALKASAQFTANRLAVYRIGDGTALTNNRTSAVFLDEYLTSGANQTAAYTVPVTDGNNRFTGIIRTSNTVFQLEGMSGLSPDGNHLAIIGYDQTTNGTVDDNTVKVVGLINAQGVVNTSTTLTGRSPARAAIALPGGNAVYSSILQGGIRYSIVGTSTSVEVNTNVSNARSFTIFNNTLYCANNSTQVPYLNNLPTASGTPTSGNINLTGISNVNQIALFDSDGDGTPNIIYAANDGANLADAGLHKFVLEGNIWTAKGFIKIAGITDGLKSVTGKVSGADIELYATTLGNLGSPKVASQLLKITDANAASSMINNTDNVPLVLATAANNTIFRSVTFTPGTAPETTLPVKLVSFKGQKKLNGISLNWNTAAETNNAYFEIWRSKDSEHFSKIGQLKGKGNSTTNQFYTFMDHSPQSGTNYYQLEQVDFDGKREKSNVIAINFDLQQTQLKVWAANPQTLNLSFNSSQHGAAQILIADLNGKKIYHGKTIVSLGTNEISLPFAPPQQGLYMISITTSNEVLNAKFLK